MSSAFEAVIRVNSPRCNKSVNDSFLTLTFEPRPAFSRFKRFKMDQITHIGCDASTRFQDDVRSHAPHLPTEEFIVANNDGLVFEIFWFVVGNQNPSGFLAS